MFCTSCGAHAAEGGTFCTACGKPVASAAMGSAQQFGEAAQKTNTSGRMSSPEIPEGVKGWSWGAFLLNWIWAIGNRTWIGLLALVPYIGILFAFWLGFKGREMAWKNREWDSVEHFDRVQKKWSRWAVGLTVGIAILGIVSAVAIPAYQDYVRRAKEKAAESAVLELPVQRLAVSVKS